MVGNRRKRRKKARENDAKKPKTDEPRYHSDLCYPTVTHIILIAEPQSESSDHSH